jgi:hypothetical protein
LYLPPFLPFVLPSFRPSGRKWVVPSFGTCWVGCAWVGCDWVGCDWVGC